MINLVIILTIQNPQNRQKKIQDIQIQRNARGNLLLNMIMPHHQLGINKDIRGEDQRRKAPINQLDGAIGREKHSNEAKQDEEPQATEEVGHPVSEVVLGLAGEEGESDEETEGEDEGLDDEPGIVEGGYDADGVSFEEGESG